MGVMKTLVTLNANLVSWNVSPDTQNVLLTTAIGEEYYENFIAFSFDSWADYAVRHDLGIVIMVSEPEDSLRFGSPNGSWLKMIAPDSVIKVLPQVERIALVDTDVIISPLAESVFAASPVGLISVVSQIKNLPFDLLEARKKLAFLRNRHYSHHYPLDSSLFAAPQSEYLSEDLPAHDDMFCAGLLVLDSAHAGLFHDWFIEAMGRDWENALAWEQVFLNHKVIDTGCFWLPYGFQAIWNLEMASYHPSLYLEGSLANSAATQRAIADTLSNRHFLHFAGSWPESAAWKNSHAKILQRMGGLESRDFLLYRDQIPTGKIGEKVLFLNQETLEQDV